MFAATRTAQSFRKKTLPKPTNARRLPPEVTLTTCMPLSAGVGTTTVGHTQQEQRTAKCQTQKLDTGHTLRTTRSVTYFNASCLFSVPRRLSLSPIQRSSNSSQADPSVLPRPSIPLRLRLLIPGYSPPHALSSTGLALAAVEWVGTPSRCLLFRFARAAEADEKLQKTESSERV